jgi:hypothetical protein
MGLFKRKKIDNQTDFDKFPPIGGLMVSKMVVDDGKKPLFMYREKRSRPEDSGWRIFSGLESQEYTDNSDNTGIYNPSTILKIDSSIADLLLKGVGSVFERESEKSDWYSVHDFELEDDYLTTIPLTDNWEITINNLFERQKEDNGDLYFTTGDKSLWLAIWNSEKNKFELHKEHKATIKNRDDSESKTQEFFDFSDSECVRIGYSIKESDENKSYDVIYGFIIVDNQVIQIALYFDNEKDKDWAIETWKNIKKK